MKIVSRHFLFWSALVALNCIVFLPSFSLGPRGDTLANLVDTSTLRSFPDLLTFFSSQTANESLLFRPLLHAFLALQIWLFRFNFFYWQALSFLLHLLVLWQAAKIFSKISPASIWYGLLVLFSVLTASAEMVAWPQISGYLIFILCFLQALKAFINILEGNDHILRMTFWLLLGALFYEFSLVCCIVFFCAIQLAKKDSKIPLKRPWLILLPLMMIVPLLFSTAPSHDMPQPLNFIKLIQSLGEVWAGIPYALLPAMLSFKPNIGRTYLNGLELSHFDISFYMNVLAILLLVVWSAYWFRQTKTPESSKRRMLSPTLGLLFILHTCFVAVRITLHPISDYMHFSLYHYYLTLLLGFFWMHSVLSQRKMPRWSSGLWVIAVALLVTVSALQTHRLYSSLAQRMSPWMNFFTTTNHFVNTHRSEKNFSFRVVYTDSTLPVPVRALDGSLSQRPEFELLFKSYISEHPAYYLVYFQNTGLKIFSTQSAAQEFTARTLSENSKP